MFKIEGSTFYEKINYNKLTYIINNKEQYKEQIEKEEKDMRRNKSKEANVSVWTILKKIHKSCIVIPNTEYAYISVTYNKGKSSNNIGRWYTDKSIGLAPLCTCVRHTICDNIWLDIDQVNSHPTIMKSFMNKFKFNSPLLNKCFDDREGFLKVIMDEENCSRDEAKTCVISCINGGKYKTPTLIQLTDELKPCINHIIQLDEYKDIYNYCRREYVSNLSNLPGKVISRILQVIENDLLETYIEFCIDKEVIPKYKNGYQVCLIFDGFQLIHNPNINDQFIEGMRIHAFEKTGYDIPLKIKPFDNKLNLPENYYETNVDEPEIEDDYPDMKFYHEYKPIFEENNCKILYPPMILHTGNLDVPAQTVKSAKETYSHLSCKIKRKKKYSNEFEIHLAQFFEIWLKDPKIRHYNKQVWKPPPLKNNDNDYNTWKPFQILSQDLIQTERDYWKEFLTYSHNLFGDQKTTDYLLARYAFRLQHPGLRSYVCVVYFGEEGDGKSKFLEVIYNIFGKNAIQLDNADKLYDKHAMIEFEKCLVCVNEANGKQNFELADILKTRITEDTLVVNPKGITPYNIDNLVDYDNTTNNLNVIKLSDNSKRRFFQCCTTTYYNGYLAFFTDFVDNIIKNPIALRQIYENLLKFDWKSIVPSGNFQDERYKPDTEIMKEVRESNRDKIVYWLMDYIKDKNKVCIKQKNWEVFKNWNYWCFENKVKIEYNAIQFGQKVKSISKNIKLKTRGEDGIVKDTNSNTFIYPLVIRKYMKVLDGTKLEFLDDDEDSQADTEETNEDSPKAPCYPLQKKQ